MDMAMLIYPAFAWVAIFGGLGAWVSSQKGRSQNEGGLLGILLGPFGVLLAALLPARDRKRP